MKMHTVDTGVFDKQSIPFFGNKYITGNGYIGVRGTMEEYRKENMPCVNIAGIYDQAGDKWRESVNAPNPLFTRITVDGKKLTLPEAEPFFHEQRLDIKTAMHSRKTVWMTAQGKITVCCERFASMADQHLIGMKYSVVADYACDIEVITGIDGGVWDINGPHFIRLTADEDIVTGITGEKGITVTTQQYVKHDRDVRTESFTDGMSAYKRMHIQATAGGEYSFTKLAAVRTSCDDF